MMPELTAQDKNWQAESDARTLAEAAEITKNKSRTRRAVAAAKKLAKDAQNTAKAVTKQARKRK